MDAVLVRGASNFYYYGKPSQEINNSTFPADQKISTQLPANIAKIRIVSILLLTAYIAIKKAGETIWRWPIFIFGISLAAYVAYKHLLKKDPLVEAFYKIAGGENEYNQLPELTLDPGKNTWQICSDRAWKDLKHPMYRFKTSDGRKGMVVKGLSAAPVKNKLYRPFAELCGVPNQLHCQAQLIFVEKFSPYDVGELKGMLHFLTLYIAIIPPMAALLKRNILYDYQRAGSLYEEKKIDIYDAISTNMANEFIEQRERGTPSVGLS